MVADGFPLLVLGVALLGLLAILRGLVWLRPWLRRRLYIPAPIEWEQGTVSADAAGDAPSSDQVYFTFAERLLDSQIATSDILDTKALSGIGVGSTVLPVTFGLLALSGQVLPAITEWLLGVAVLVYIGLLVAAGAARRIRAFEFRPDLMTLQCTAKRSKGRRSDAG
ncbi:MAG: hypothetical protein M3464_07690 [Chloroflexota bacterium]|nr:hypothetical protein [Chloroflexota bacterium]